MLDSSDAVADWPILNALVNTYTQLHIPFVFAVKYGTALIQESWQYEIHKYITRIFQRYEHKMLQINSMADHTHILNGLQPSSAGHIPSRYAVRSPHP